MKEFHKHLKMLQSQKERNFVKATVIQIIGSAYRHEGAMMFFGEDGTQYGTLSAGCLEEDLTHHAAEVMANRQPKLVDYDLTTDNDIMWGIGSGCNGKIKIFLEPISWGSIPPNFKNEPVLPKVEQLLEQGKILIIARCVDGKVKSGTTMLYSDLGEVKTSRKEDHGMEQIILKSCQEFLYSKENFKLMYLRDLESNFIFERVEPKDKLFIFGAGPDIEPIVEFASTFDFLPIVIDPRSTRCNREIFPSAYSLINEHPESFFNQNQIPENSYVLVMTHNFLRDKQILDLLSRNASPKYIGILGPRKRTERLVPSGKIHSKIYSPVGLNIGAEGPEEISLSILAQLIRIRNNTPSEKALNV